MRHLDKYRHDIALFKLENCPPRFGVIFYKKIITIGKSELLFFRVGGCSGVSSTVRIDGRYLSIRTIVERELGLRPGCLSLYRLCQKMDACFKIHV